MVRRSTEVRNPSIAAPRLEFFRQERWVVIRNQRVGITKMREILLEQTHGSFRRRKVGWVDTWVLGVRVH